MRRAFCHYHRAYKIRKIACMEIRGMNIRSTNIRSAY